MLPRFAPSRSVLPTDPSPLIETQSLFAPATIAGLALKNRWVMAPMTRTRSPGGVPTELSAEYYRRRAAGGIGLIITEGALTDHPQAGAYANTPHLSAAARPGWQQIVQACHAAGTKVLVQVWHCGPVSRPGVGAEAVSENGQIVVRAATKQDKEALLASYSRAALEARIAGFDGLELHAAHGYLLDSFLRTGDVGYVRTVVEETRRQVGPTFPIVLRFSTWKVQDYGARYIESPDHLTRLLEPLASAGVNIFHPSVRRFWEPAFPGRAGTLAEWTRRTAGLPVIAVGNIGLDPDKLAGKGPDSLAAVQAGIDQGHFDLCAIGRPLLTEPDWVRLVAAGEFARIRPYHEHAARDVFP
jgi:2,4-dienoyl-CoA reductase-like NADH-dependent reductase (Old Yellow Enzyme family)